jgi:hypothetical protein
MIQTQLSTSPKWTFGEVAEKPTFQECQPDRQTRARFSLLIPIPTNVNKCMGLFSIVEISVSGLPMIQGQPSKASRNRYISDAASKRVTCH